MGRSNRKFLTILLGILAVSILFAGAPTNAIAANGGEGAELDADFVISSSLENDGNNAKLLCDNDFADAKAEIEIREKHGKTSISIEVDGTSANTFYTAWLRLKAPKSPLTGSGATPLAPSTALNFLQNADGKTNIPNGFFTNSDGEGEFEVTLDFLLLTGDGYPFPGVDPVAIGDNNPFTIRLASHCRDNVGHGLSPGQHERIFDIVF